MTQRTKRERVCVRVRVRVRVIVRLRAFWYRCGPASCPLLGFASVRRIRGNVLAGPKSPFWSCSCGMDGNCASRVCCRKCEKPAPQRIANADQMSTHGARANAPLSRKVSGRPRQRAFESRSQRALRSTTGYHRARSTTGSHCALTHNWGAGHYYGGLFVEHLSTGILPSGQSSQLRTVHLPFHPHGCFNSHRVNPLARSLSTCDKGPFGRKHTEGSKPTGTPKPSQRCHVPSNTADIQSPGWPQPQPF